MIKIKEFTELTEKEKASIRELIDDCIRYEQSKAHQCTFLL